jgi:putative ABC transport system permease protein
MIRNYLLIATRNLKNSILFSFINVIGLSIGIGCCLVIGLFLADQYSYDKHHEHADEIFRVVNKQIQGSSSNYVAVTQGVLAPELLKTFPEIKEATRVGFNRHNIKVGNQEPSEQKIMAVDPAFFSMFTIPFKIKPSGQLVQSEAYISEEASTILFGDKNPIGETLIIDKLGDLKIAGVFADLPYQSHLQTDFIISFSWIEKSGAMPVSWNSNSYFNYLLMPKNFDRGEFNKKMNTFIHRFTPASWSQFEYFLQPLLGIHLDGGYISNPSNSIGKVLVLGFSMVGGIILLLACFNYMNLATARSVKRSMEVGVRKVMGAKRTQLIFQFLTESFILCLLSFLLAILWADLSIPFFNAFTGWRLSISNFFNNPSMLSGVIASFLLLTLLAGSYPAFFLSRFLPREVLKGQSSSNSSRRLRKILVLIQFTLTSVLVVVVIVVFRQTNFLRTQQLGFNKEQLLLFEGDRKEEIGLEAFKDEMLKIPGVVEVAVTSDFPGRPVNTSSLNKSSETENQSVKIQWLFADHDFIPTLELNLVQGRNFNANGNDENKSVIINENAAAAFGWTIKEAIGQKVSGFIFSDSLPGEIIGVVNDYHATSLRREIMPLVIGYNTSSALYMARFEGENSDMVRQLLDKTASKYMIEHSYKSMLMEDSIEQIYAGETKTGQMLTLFTILAEIIGCTGLYALSAYEGEQRTKELGIRKIMGATTRELLLLISKSFLKLIVISLFIATPLAYFLANIWLRSFAYKIPWTADIFIESSLCVLLLGWFTILSQALRASRMNPVSALRYE